MTLTDCSAKELPSFPLLFFLRSLCSFAASKQENDGVKKLGRCNSIEAEAVEHKEFGGGYELALESLESHPRQRIPKKNETRPEFVQRYLLP